MNSLRARIRAFRMRLVGTLRPGRGADDFDAELESHIAMHVDDGLREGLSPEEARQQALVRLGGAEQTRQAHRERRGVPWLETFVQDVRYGFRTLRRAPGFTVTAVLTLGLGIGACTAIFSLVNAVLIRSLPYGDPERLVYLFTPNPDFKIPPEIICPSYGDFYDIKRDSKTFVDMTAYEQASFNVAAQGGMHRIGAARVDQAFFSTLASWPELGRAIGADDNQQGHDKVAVISDSLWVSMFGGRGDVLQRRIQLDGANHQIIGVMPPGFEYPFSSDLPYGNPHIKSTQIWVPLALTPKQQADREPGADVTVARLRPGVRLEQAQAEMSAMMARLIQLHAPESRHWQGLVESFTGISIGPVRPLMRLLLATVANVLLIACGNAANLLLARSAERGRELGVRAALGAGRGRMIRQLLTEALPICIGGGVVGVGLTVLFLRVLPRLDPGNIPRLNEASLDGHVLLASIAFSLLTSLFTGLLPAWSASRTQLTEFLKTHTAHSHAATSNRMQNVLIISQTAMVVVLLAAAGLLIRSYINVESVDTGFTKSTMTFNLTLDSRYSKAEQRRAFFEQIISKLATLPGVSAVGAIDSLPLSNSESLSTFWVKGYPNQRGQLAESRHATADYFKALGVPLVAGRLLTKDDYADGANAIVVNQSFVEKYFAGRDPIGGQVAQDDDQKTWRTIVGVVGNVRHSSLEEPPGPQIYFSFAQADWASNAVPVSWFVAIQSSVVPAILGAEIRATLQNIDPNLAVADIHTMGDLVSQASARRRFQTSLLTAFAAIALVLALVGLYGLMAYSVNRRTREVGIRMALGAQRGDVLMLVLKNAGVLIGSGLAAGLVCAWISARAIRAFLFGVSEHDPVTVVVVCALLMICGLLAALVPARRAASIDPMRALRTE